MRSSPALAASILALSLSLQTLSSMHVSTPSSRGPLLHTPALRVLVPAYFHPLPGSPWPRLSAAAQAHPGRVVAIGDPFNGPGASFDSTYAGVFADFRAHGGVLLGYLSSSYATRPIADVLKDLDTWLAWYPIDGVFVDEMDNTPGANESYYQAIYHVARTKIPNALVIANPGTSTSSSYLHLGSKPVASTLCIYENGVGFSSWHSDAWEKQSVRQAFCALAYKLGASGWQAAVDHAYAENCGWVDVTDDDLPNPWDTLPAYFESLVAYIDANY